MIRGSARQVAIKGIREGLLISLGDGDFGRLLVDLTSELKEKQGFLSGSQVALDVGARRLNSQAIIGVQALLAEYDLTLWAVLAEPAETKEAARSLELATRLSGSKTDLDGRSLEDRSPEETNMLLNNTTTAPQTQQATANGLLLHETLRSGRSIYHEGHVIIIGDVNPGAEIIAGGNVVVWGKLRGVVHAGAHGDASAIICALELIPTQLRIADQIAIAPGDQGGQSVPESASIQDGRIVARVWHVRN